MTNITTFMTCFSCSFIQQREIKPKIENGPVVELRRSTRERNPIHSYTDDVSTSMSFREIAICVLHC